MAILHPDSLLAESSFHRHLQEDIPHHEVIDGTKLSPEELKKFLKITPQP